MTEAAGQPATTPEWRTDDLGGLASSFTAAADATGVTLDRCVIAGAPVSLKFASPALRERVMPAFSHLVEQPAAERVLPELTVFLWDSASTGAEPPSRPHIPGDHAAGALFHFDRPPVRAAYQPGVEAFSVFDSRARIAWHWVADAFDQAYWDQACPIRQILFWWLSSRNYLQVHGAAVGKSSGGVLLVGRGGSGKSTVALASLGSELLYAGDDYVAATIDPSPRIESLYNSGKLEPVHIRQHLPHLLPLLANADKLDSEKGVMYVQKHFPHQTTSGFPLVAVIVPTVRAGQQEHRVVNASRATAFAALAPSTIFQLHTARPDTLTAMSRLIESVPCYGLELGSDVTSIPGTVSEFLSSLNSD